MSKSTRGSPWLVLLASVAWSAAIRAQGIDAAGVRGEIRTALDLQLARPVGEGRLPRLGLDPLRRLPQPIAPVAFEDRVTRDRIREVATRAAARDLAGDGPGHRRGPGAGRREDRRDDRRDRRDEKRDAAQADAGPGAAGPPPGPPPGDGHRRDRDGGHPRR